MTTDIHIQKTFNKYSIKIILEFISSFSPNPNLDNYIFFKVRSKEGFIQYVWGVSVEEVIERFNDFLKLYIFM